MSFRALALTAMTVGCLALASCASRQVAMATHDEVAGIDEISELYVQATAPHRRAVRKPIRDQRAEALRKLSETAEVVIAETETWSGDARLTSIDESRRDQVRAAVREFRESLRGIQTAAAAADLRQLRTQYAIAMAHYRELEATVPPIE